MAHRLLQDPSADGWERSDFPIVCETCLGPNPYVRMQRIEFGGTCHISGRPYTVFRWRPGNDARYKKTIVCQEVAKAKNVCQVCLLDLDYNLPVQVRDQALGMAGDALPQSDPGREFALKRMEDSGELDRSKYDTTAPNELLLRLQRTTPYYKRNRAQICSFFVRGECKRGAECPYRHEMPITGDLADQNIKDRYYGVNDPVANKMMNRAATFNKVEPPSDLTIMTLFVGSLTPEITEDDLRDAFYPYGELRSVRKVDARSCGFVTYTTREAAERAAEALASKLVLRGQRCKLLWGKPQQPRGDGAGPSGAPPSTAGGPPAAPYGSGSFGPGGGASGGYYPSMDPLQAGARMEQAKRQSDYPDGGSQQDKRQRGPPPGRPAPPQGPPGA